MDWMASIGRSNLQCIWWIFCPGHAGVRGNLRADILTGKATEESPLTLDAPTVLALLQEHIETTRVDASLMPRR